MQALHSYHHLLLRPLVQEHTVLDARSNEPKIFSKQEKGGELFGGSSGHLGLNVNVTSDVH